MCIHGLMMSQRASNGQPRRAWVKARSNIVQAMFSALVYAASCTVSQPMNHSCTLLIGPADSFWKCLARTQAWTEGSGTFLCFAPELPAYGRLILLFSR